MNANRHTSIKALLRHQRPLMLQDSHVRRTIVDGSKTIEFGTTKEKSKGKRVLSDGTRKQKRHLEPFIKSKSQILRSNSGLSDKNIVNFKAVMFSRTTKARIGSPIPIQDNQIKVGIIGSQGRIGQTVQGAGSVITPGDLSNVRSPIRSRIYSALAPGGGVNARIVRNRNERGYRCPAGFAHGGRFTDRNYSTCGAQLFEIPSVLAQAVNRIVNRPSVGEASATDASRVVRGVQSDDRAIQILRMAQIPRNGADNREVRARSVDKSIAALTGAPSGESRLIRRDGIMLRSLVPSSVLRNFGGNPDMEDGVFLRSIDKPSDIVGDDLALLSGPAIQRVGYVMPNGSIISIERQRPLTVGERRKFGRQLNRVAGTSDKYDVGNNIRDFASSSGGAFKYSEKFPNIEKPLDLIEVEDANGKKIQVRRWVYETFMKDDKGTKKPVAKFETEKLREDGASVSGAPSTLKDAVSYIDGGGDPFDLSSEFISEALKRSKNYYPRKLGTGITEYSSGSGKYIYSVPETRDNAAIAEKVYSDVSSQLGLLSPPVRLGGKSGSREAIIGDVSNDGNKVDLEQPLNKIDASDMMRTFMSDFLTDARDRSPATLRPVVSGNKVTVIPSGNELSALAGLDTAEIKNRFDLDLPDYLDGRNSLIYKQRFGDLSAKDRNEVLSVYDTLINRARKFNWKEYSSRLAADGQLSQAEQAHLEIVQRMYEKRLSILVEKKKQVISLLGI